MKKSIVIGFVCFILFSTLVYSGKYAFPEYWDVVEYFVNTTWILNDRLVLNGTVEIKEDLIVTGDAQIGGILSGTSPVKIDGVNISNNIFSLIENRNQSLRFTLQNLNDSSNATAVISALNDIGHSMSIGIGSSTFTINNTNFSNVAALFSRSKGPTVFANSYAQPFTYLYNYQDDNDFSNVQKIMELNGFGLNISENLTIGGLLILPNIVQLSPSQSSVLRRDDSSGVVGVRFGVQGSDVGEADASSGAAYVWIVENGTSNYTIDLHSSLDPNNPNQVVHHLRGNITGEVWRLDGGESQSFTFEAAKNKNVLLSMNKNGLITFNNSFRILPNGNIGIGITTPLEKLHVSGNLNVSENLYVGGCIIYDGATASPTTLGTCI